MADARTTLAQRLRDALSRTPRILPDDDPDWLFEEAKARELWAQEPLADHPIPPPYESSEGT
jgi:hypothetical protein